MRGKERGAGNLHHCKVFKQKHRHVECISVAGELTAEERDCRPVQGSHPKGVEGGSGG